ncbi:MAG: hypothetical protein IPJ01_12025 [Micavibrio sp.]|nr:hypothetical protein [Micavibrio sp.]
MRIGFFTWSREWVSMADLLTVQRLSIASAREKSKLKRVSYAWQIIKILTAYRNPFSVFLYPKIVAAFDFTPDTTAAPASIEEIEKRILGICADIGSRCGKLPREVATGLAFSEMDLFYKNTIARQLEKSLALMSAYHAPDTFGKQVLGRLKKIHAELTEGQATKAEIANRPADADEPVKIRNMFPRFA